MYITAQRTLLGGRNVDVLIFEFSLSNETLLQETSGMILKMLRLRIITTVALMLCSFGIDTHRNSHTTKKATMI